LDTFCPIKGLYNDKAGCFGECNGPKAGTVLILPCQSTKDNMKTTLTLIALIFTGTMAMAQNGPTEPKAVLEVQTVSTALLVEQAGKDRKIARLYKFKNSKVKKALSFSTKNNNTKLA